MSLDIFSTEMIFIHPQIFNDGQEGVIHYLCSRMVEKEYITEEYYHQVIEREKKHPTGLPTLPFASAVPHADPIGVKSTGIALAVLEQPVDFKAMDNPRRTLAVSLVFLMSFIKGDQIAVLRWISNVLGNQEIVQQIATSTQAVQAYKIIEPFLKSI